MPTTSTKKPFTIPHIDGFRFGRVLEELLSQLNGDRDFPFFVSLSFNRNQEIIQVYVTFEDGQRLFYAYPCVNQAFKEAIRPKPYKPGRTKGKK